MTYENISDRVRISRREHDPHPLNDSTETFTVEYLDARGDWRHWCSVLYLPMARSVANRRADELQNRGLWL
jgi:hypothetical protein